MKIPFNKSPKNFILKYRAPLDHSVGNVYLQVCTVQVLYSTLSCKKFLPPHKIELWITIIEWRG